MQNTTERRQLILEAISDRRHVAIAALAEDFGVSRRTVERDIEILACSYPIFTESWRGGGVRAMDGWYVNKRYMTADQEALLRKLLPGLQPEDQKTMERILMSFAKPSIKEADR